MGASDYRKVNDQWAGGEENRQKLDEFYTSDAPSTGKSKGRKHGGKKSDHKHVYEDVILVFSNGKYFPCKGRRCTICAKVDLIGFFIKRAENGYSQITYYDEVIAAHPDMPIVEGDWI
jgi:hypothetical protein